MQESSGGIAFGRSRIAWRLLPGIFLPGSNKVKLFRELQIRHPKGGDYRDNVYQTGDSRRLVTGF